MKRVLLIAITILICLGACGKEPQGPEVSQTPQISEGVVIALLDTGVSTTAITSDHLLTGYNYVEDSTDTEDRINHGTAVASAILGCASAGIEATAPEAYVVPLVVMTKVEGKVLSVQTEVLAKAIREAVDVYQADIINISLGIQKDDDGLKAAVEYAFEQGVLVVSAVGNDGATGMPYYPAAYDCVLAVGSHDENGEESDFSHLKTKRTNAQRIGLCLKKAESTTTRWTFTPRLTATKDFTAETSGRTLIQTGCLSRFSTCSSVLSAIT